MFAICLCQVLLLVTTVWKSTVCSQFLFYVKGGKKKHPNCLDARGQMRIGQLIQAYRRATLTEITE